jgi:selenocysteine lyase/cysteine desulfurase
MDRFEKLAETIRGAIIGRDQAIDGPFGPRRVTYADYTASGRSLEFIEDYMRRQVMPLYANTHTETSGTGRQTSAFREEARSIIHAAVGGGDDDVVLFCGSGATAAINKLVGCLGIRIPCALEERYDLSEHIPLEERPVVFIGPYEHHSNELPWRESIADVVVIDLDEDGRLSLEHLERELIAHAARPLKIGSFSAASNVTGIGSKTAATAILLHKHGALSFWDFAAAGPYVEIEMNLRQDGPDGHLAYKDAIFISPHKFIGGPGTPGLLVAKKHLFQNKVPASPGGGTVAYVSPSEHRYLDDIVQREEGGTPDILGSIRAGLVFQLKEAVGFENIQRSEERFIRAAIDRWGSDPNISVLGSASAWRLSIVSFQVRHGQGWLHHDFVVALLNDLFGLQARGGCSCAGPYGHRLLGIEWAQSKLFEEEIVRGCEGIKPGWVRVNFNYFLDETTVRFILDAVTWVAAHGWKLLPLYRFCAESGRWQHRDGLAEPLLSLATNSYAHGRLATRSRTWTEPEEALLGYLDEADAVLARTVARYGRGITPEPLPDHFERLRWFTLPHEALDQLLTETER